MKCPNCNKNVSELDEKCPICGLNFDKYEEDNKTTEDETSFTKTAFIKIINILQIIGFIIMAIIAWNNEEILQGFIYVVIGLVIFAFIKGFSDIIDLLDSINDKLDK